MRLPPPGHYTQRPLPESIPCNCHKNSGLLAARLTSFCNGHVLRLEAGIYSLLRRVILLHTRTLLLTTCGVAKMWPGPQVSNLLTTITTDSGIRPRAGAHRSYSCNVSRVCCTGLKRGHGVPYPRPLNETPIYV